MVLDCDDFCEHGADEGMQGAGGAELRGVGAAGRGMHACGLCACASESSLALYWAPLGAYHSNLLMESIKTPLPVNTPVNVPHCAYGYAPYGVRVLCMLHMHAATHPCFQPSTSRW